MAISKASTLGFFERPPDTSPQSKGMAERFVKTLKRDYAKLVNWPDSKTKTAQLKDWFDG